MKHIRIGVLAAFLLVIVLAPAAQAHTPLGSGGNESPETATVVPDPTKSWAVYAELHEGHEAQYYRFDIAEGGRIHAMLFTTTSPEETGFLPGLVLLGPGLELSGTVPDHVEVPNGTTAIVVDGERAAQVTYEPFAPSAFVQLAEIELSAPATGTYYLAVHAEDRGGRYGLAIGDRESFTALEWVVTPFSLLGVYEWEGQNLALVLAPAIAVIATGLGLLLWRRGVRGLAPQAWIAAAAGLLSLGSAGTVLSQMAFALTQAPAGGEVLITLIFGALPLGIGIAGVRLALTRSTEWSARARLYAGVLGALALVFWAGWIVGPALAIASAVLPSKSGPPARHAKA